ncbi:DUF6522 family protein [Sinorhizobium alkalisoli]|uniref:Uncharacterized protein n=1 Tax=Sinorhizobium alkalisoli TaxID=1752398 RepID=A0A1E3VGU1_9HYPH|nr:DUF6522 family protein [Sinorhizobium alkalisoli]ODR92810.1 hypothetical protein A8M32_03265 [Sinorhizobium alkalisoli]
MKVERTQNGDLIVDPTELANRFGISMDDLRRYFRKGLVTSMVERGEGNHAGTCRLSVKLGNRVWRAIVNSECRVVSEETVFYRASSRMLTNVVEP